MPVFDRLTRAAAERDLQFLVTGAHAVIRHGYMRATADVDFLANKEQREAWLELVLQLGYGVEHDGESFVQLSPPKHL